MYQIKLMYKRREFQLTFFIMMLVCIAAFVVSCIQNYSVDLTRVLSADKTFILRDLGSNFLFLLVYILPVFVVLPFADSYYTDQKENIVPLVVTRTGVKKYFFSKLYSVAISSTIVTLIPFSVNYILGLIAFPLVSTNFHKASPSAEQAFYYSDNTLSHILFPEIFVNHPYLYNLIFMFLLTLFLVICSILVYELSYYIDKSRLFILSMLFITNDVLILLSNTPIIGGFIELSPSSYFTAYDITPNKSIGYLIFLFVSIIVAIICLIPGCISKLNGKGKIT